MDFAGDSVARPGQGPSLQTSQAFCILPWTHLSVRWDGRVTPCCMSEHTLGSLRDSTLLEVWNSDTMRQLRLAMLQGRPHAACARCHEYEDYTSEGLRQTQNKRLASHFSLVGSTRPDGTLSQLNLPYWDIKFSNVCNLRCRYCEPAASTKWYQEGLLFPHFVKMAPDDPQLRTPTRDPKDLWRQLEGLIPQLEEIYFAGGEPLIMDECYEILKILVARKMFHVRLVFNTNFSVTEFKGNDIMKLWDQFEDVGVGASLDAADRRGEYIRKGLRWDQVLRNRERMFKACPRVRFYLAPTMTIMNVLHFPDFYTDWLKKGYISPIYGAGALLMDPPEYRIQVLPKHLKDQVVEKYESCIEKVLKPYGQGGEGAISRFRSILQFMADRDMTDHLDGFRNRTRLLDESRKERFTDVFPELAELMQAP